MATKRPTKRTDAAKAKREVANVRVYWEQCDLINELADAGRNRAAIVLCPHFESPRIPRGIPLFRQFLPTDIDARCFGS